MAQPSSDTPQPKTVLKPLGIHLSEALRHPRVLFGILALLAATIFISELIMAMLLETFPGINPLMEAVIDSAVLILLLSPTTFVLYQRFVVRSAPPPLSPASQPPSVQRLRVTGLKLPSNLLSRKHVLVMVLVLGAIIFCGEVVVMFLFVAFPVTSPLLEAFVDATVLVTLVSPALYSLFYLPVRRRVEALSDSEREIRALTQRLMEVSEEEQRSLALDLHDEFSQTLSAMKLEVDALSESAASDPGDLPRTCTSLHQRIQELRHSVHAIAVRLRPSILDDLGIVPALESLTSDFQQRYPHIHFDLAVTGIKTRPGMQVETALYRISQEALTNAVKHARPGRIELRLTASFPDIILLIRDDGCGYDTERNLSREAPGKHLGILGMRERARILGGQLTVQSRKDLGTTVRAVFPVEEFKT